MAKILVADDNSNIQKMVGLALKDQGIDVVAVGNGEAAVRKLLDVRPDLVLADVFMPVRNGYEVCEYVKNHVDTSHVPVILLVGAFDPLDEQEAQRVRADGVLKKPFVPPDPLISMVKAALAKAGVPLSGAPAAEKAPMQAASLIAHPPVMPKELASIPAVEATPQLSISADEEISTRPAPLKIEANDAPLAFSGLLETAAATKEEEEAPEILQGRSPERDWGASKVAEVEEEEEVSASKSWRRDAAEEAFANTSPSSISDWRDALRAGHAGDAAQKHQPWTPEQESRSRLEDQVSDEAARTSLPEIVAEIPAVASAETELAPATEALAEEPRGEMTALLEPVETSFETQHSAQHFLAPTAVETGVAVEASPATIETHASVTTETVPQTETEPEAAPTPSWEPVPVSAEVAAAPEPHVAPELIEEAPSLEEPVAAIIEPKAAWDSPAETVPQLASAWEPPADFAPVAPAEPYVPEPAVTAYAGQEHSDAKTSALSEMPAPEIAATEHSPEASSISLLEKLPTDLAPLAAHENHSAAPQSAAQQPAPDVEALIAKVLEKMSPEVLQAVTREILKPVIEAILKDELKTN